jgi:hypothetical protein
MKDKASVGLRARTGRTIAVVLVGSSDSPMVLQRRELSLVDPNLPATFQPYHEVMELPWKKAQVAVRKLADAVERMATKGLAQLILDLQADNYSVSGIGIVGAPERTLEKIGSPHIRAHAAEGVLFRHVLEIAAKRNRIHQRTFAEHKFIDLAASELKFRVEDLERRLTELGRAVGRPWRADEKAAATAAWLALAGREHAKAKA